jgi:hypothetical protein
MKLATFNVGHEGFGGNGDCGRNSSPDTICANRHMLMMYKNRHIRPPTIVAQ